jgi:hypothetical protein
LVAGQDVEPADDDGTWRIARRTASDRVISTVDPDSRHVHKVRAYRDRYKAHVIVEPTDRSDLRPQAHRRQRPRRSHWGRAHGQRTPGPPGARRLRLRLGRDPCRTRRRKHRPAIKPWPMADTGRFDRDAFTVNHTARTATCPAGHTVKVTARGNATFDRFCNAGCDIRSQCTTAKDGRTLRLKSHDAELVEARRTWRDGDFADD